MSDSEQPQGFFKKASKWVKDSNELARREAAEAKDAEAQFYEEASAKYGLLVASEIFELRRIEIFDKGWIRVGGMGNTKGGPPRGFTSTDYVVAYDAPFERLRAIKFTSQVQDKSAGGRAVASAASFGLSNLASNEKRVLFLTISTDQNTYALKENAGMLRTADQIPMRLELTGQGVLDALSVNPSGSVRTESATPDGGTGSVADELAKFVALREAGVITDEEFAAQKAKLLGL